EQAAVGDCVTRGVLVAHDGTLSFRHELARRATADALAPAQRQARHARLLAALSDPPDGVAPPPLSRLAHHAAEAGDSARVLELAPRAAREAAQLGAHREAALQLEAALRFADSADAGLRAQLHESWSYEAGLSLAIDDRVITARHRAIGLWRQLGRIDKVGHNLRWLSRLHWYQGDKAKAERYADEAVATLEPLPPGPELAWAYSVRSQLFMLKDCTDEAVQWGERAIALADRLGEAEIRCHALNNVGTAELFAGRPGGHEKLEQSLALALAGGFHEQAARVYTNASEHAVVFKDHATAERMLVEGIAFDRQHDLDAWTHYLVGWLAQLRLEQGRLDDAERIADEVLATPRLTAVMRLPALTVRARVHMRRASPDASRLLDEALALAVPTGEVQRVAPLVTAQAEDAWLRDDPAACLAALRRLDDLPGAGVNAWEAGEIAAWRQRAGEQPAIPPHAARPWMLELQGDLAAAATAWKALGAPNEAALVLLRLAMNSHPRSNAAAPLAEAVRLLEDIGAKFAARKARQLARDWGLRGHMPAVRAGAREHPRGLSAREQQVLVCLSQGLRNPDLAKQLGVAQRTVEHHVSSVLSKLEASDRADAVAVARREGLLPP
ncbi:MAG TPA: LuxR C-terminal-related transcriptional regulator, partial [Albitalea sp.]|nr:LuxR C-terminal-related transcriptional regulator [Albitalea sp.]